MGCMAGAAPLLLAHVALWLAVLCGASVATAARLKWDPSTYVAARALFPAEYRAAAAALLAAPLALLALQHLALLALALPPAGRCRRALLLTYAALTALLACGEAAWAAWTAARVAAWLRSQQAHDVADLLQLGEHLQPLLALLSKWHPLPAKLQEILQEAAADAPLNARVAGGAALAAALLQVAAALLALVCAARPPRPAPPPATPAALDALSYVSTDNEEAPLKTAFRNGKLVIL